MMRFEVNGYNLRLEISKLIALIKYINTFSGFFTLTLKVCFR